MGKRLHARTATARRARGPLAEEFFDWPAVAFWSGAALVAVVVLIGLLLSAGPLGIDRRWSEWMRDTQTDALHQLALVFNWLGRGIGRALSLAAIGVALTVARRWWALAAFAAAESLTPLASNLTKHLVGRPRPEQGLLHLTGSSFPSGHTAYAAATCVALVLLYARSSRHRRILRAAAGLAIAGMAWSRTYLEVHWLTDVIGGALLGVGVTLLSFAGEQLIGPGVPSARPRRRPPDSCGSRPHRDHTRTAFCSVHGVDGRGGMRVSAWLRPSTVSPPRTASSSSARSDAGASIVGVRVDEVE